MSAIRKLALESLDPLEIIQEAASTFGDQTIMSSSLGAESAVLIHMATHIMPRIKIVVIDTGYLFPETHRFLQDLRNRFDLNIWTYRTSNDPIEYLARAGEGHPAFRNDIERCCAANKAEPFERAMRQLQPAAWLRGIRRDQAETRQDRRVLERNEKYACWAISPLLNWNTIQMHEYLKAHDLPLHPLYHQGYASIGCNPLSCTRPIMPGENARAGRWTGISKTECGLHLDAGSGI